VVCEHVTDQAEAEHAFGRSDREDQAGNGGSTAARDAVAIVGTYLVLGAVAALLWWLFVDPAVFTRSQDGGVTMGEMQLAEQFNADGWYVVIAGVLGMVSGAVLTWWRSRDFLLTVALLTVGSGFAASLMAWLGGVLGPTEPSLVEAATGTRLPAPLEVASPVCYLVWPIAALIGSLLVLWSPPTGTSAP
jgi:hypothetical protein